MASSLVRRIRRRLRCAHEVFHLRRLQNGSLRTGVYIVEQALDMMLRYAPLERTHFTAQRDELTERLGDCLSFAAGPDLIGGQEDPWLLAMLL